MMANRARRYVVGAAGGHPLPLSVADISAVLDAHPSWVPRAELDACIFALDAEFLDSLEDKPKPQKDVASAWSGVVAAVSVGAT